MIIQIFFVAKGSLDIYKFTGLRHHEAKFEGAPTQLKVHKF